MKLVTFVGAGAVAPRIGALTDGDAVIDLTLAHASVLAALGRPSPSNAAAEELPADMLALLQAGDLGLERARAALAHAQAEGVDVVDGTRVRHAAGEIKLLAPLPRPNSLRDYMVVEEHVRNCLPSIPPEWFNLPVYYKGNVGEIYGPEDVIPWPTYTDKLDYELEICAVIGRAGRHIAEERAEEHIIGYTIYNDWSARDIQLREMSVGLGPSYSKDFASSIGPCIATVEEFDRDHAPLQARVDGEFWSEGVLGKMHFSFEELIAWTSREQTLQPGDLLGSGTVGRGCGLELDRWLTEGCIVELSAQGIGVLRNQVGRKGEGAMRAVSLASTGFPEPRRTP